MLVRSTFLVLTSQAIFLISGMAINFVLARLLGPHNYGTFGLVMSILIFTDLFVHTGIPEAVKKFGGENPESIRNLVEKTVKWQILYCVIMFLLLFLLAPFIAKIFHDEKLIPFIKIASINVLFYGMYKYVAGIQNGLHNFFKFTSLAIIYSFTRVVAIIGLTWAGFSLTGALLGNVIASLVALFIGVLITRLPKTDVIQEKFTTRSYLDFVLPNVLYFVGLNSLFTIDLWFVKYFLGNLEVGLYVAAATLAKLPYLFSVGLSAVLLPSISRAVFLKDDKRVDKVVFESLRYLLIFLFLLIVLFISNDRLIMETFFGIAYSDAGPVLTILIVGLSLFTIMAVIHTVLISHNLMKLCFVQIVILLVIDTVLNFILVPRYHLMGAAISTASVGFIGIVMSSVYKFRYLKDLVFSPITLRLGFAFLIVYYVSNHISSLVTHIIPKSIILTVFYLFILIITREINSVELRRLRHTFNL